MNSTTLAGRTKHISRPRRIAIFIGTIVFGYFLFIFPNLLLGITGMNGGLKGINLLFVGLFQITAVTALVHLSLSWLGMNWPDIGWVNKSVLSDAVLGLLVGLGWTAVQFAILIPATGGATRPDILQILEGLDGSMAGMIGYLGLGVLGGAVAEEIFNRGYFINVLNSTFRNKKRGLYIAAALSAVIFIIGHLPGNAVELLDILVPTLAYTTLFIHTGRLTASIVAHGVWNASAVILISAMYG